MILASLAVALGGVGEPDAAWGEVLAGLAGCRACHTADDGPPYAGGHAIETGFGTFYGTNLTPDPTHGLGGWSFEDFTRAMRRGRSPTGRPYWPAFPYPSFTGFTDDDLADLWAHLQAVPADPTPSRDHEVGGRWRVGPWRWVSFRAERWAPDPAHDPRGAYLGEVVGHCGECHTPRDGWGRPERDCALTGADGPPYRVPGLGPGSRAAGWTDDDLDSYLFFGMTPSGDVAGRGMWHVVDLGTSKLSSDDRAALIRWLRARAAPQEGCR